MATTSTTTYAASAPQTTASQPIPVDIRTTKALTIEIAKVPDGKTVDPHWTAYVQAIGTPIVAVIAAIIAATIQWRQWQTAKAAAETARNKLKLDLFEKRFAVYSAAMTLQGVMADNEQHDDTKVMGHITKLRGAEFLFDEEVNDFLMNEIIDKTVQMMRLQQKIVVAKNAGNLKLMTELVDKREELATWFKSAHIFIKTRMQHFLHLTH